MAILPAPLSRGVLLPASVLHTSWYHALSLSVGLNTLVFAALSVVQLLPAELGGTPPGADVRQSQPDDESGSSAGQRPAPSGSSSKCQVSLA